MLSAAYTDDSILMPSWQAVWHGTKIQLQRGLDTVASVTLPHGGLHQWFSKGPDTHVEVLQALQSCAGVAVMSAEGDLLGSLSVAANLSLALEYGQSPDSQSRDALDALLLDALSQCGMEVAVALPWSQKRIGDLDRPQRWLAGLLRHLVRPPELLVLDRCTEGLALTQWQSVQNWVDCFTRLHPFRPVVLLDREDQRAHVLACARPVIRLGGS